LHTAISPFFSAISFQLIFTASIFSAACFLSLDEDIFQLLYFRFHFFHFFDLISSIGWLLSDIAISAALSIALLFIHILLH
jgi:hypothetical protein